MEVKVSRVFVFPTGARIDLFQVIAIDPIDKDINGGTIYVPVHVKYKDKPIHFKLGYSIGKTDEEQKEKIKIAYTNFIMEWEQYIIEQQKN